MKTKIILSTIFLILVMNCKTTKPTKNYNNISIKKNNLNFQTIEIATEEKNIIPKTYIDYYHRANSKMELKEYNGAVKDYNKALQIAVKLIKSNTSMSKNIIAEILHSRGIAKYKSKKYKEAIKDYDKAIKINSKYSFAYNNRGISQSAIGKYFKALKDYNKALEINPKFSEAYNNSGVAKFKLGRYTDAIDDFNIAINLYNKNVNFFINRGSAKAKIGEYESAFDDYSFAMNLEPENQLARLYQLKIEEFIKTQEKK